MATLYVRNDGSNTAPYDTWAKAATTLATAAAAASAGDTVYVGDGHSEGSGSDITIDCSSGTVANPIKIICVDDTGDPEPPTAVVSAPTALVDTVTTGGPDVNIHGHAYIYGIIFRVGDGGATNAILSIASGVLVSNLKFEQCEFYLNNSHNASEIRLGVTGSDDASGARFEECDIRFGASGQSFTISRPLTWVGGSVLGTAPTTLFASITANEGFSNLVQLLGVDLSLITGTIVSGSGTMRFHARDCKLGASVTIASSLTYADGDFSEAEIINCDSADTNYRYTRHTIRGIESQETTIVLDASDGTTTFSRKIVSNSNAREFISPYISRPVLLWNETVGSSQTATVEVITDNVTLQDDEAWIEVEYLGTSGYPLGAFTSDKAADILATPANQTTSSASWVTTGLTTPVKQALSVSFTAQEKGFVRAYICLAKPSTTMYYNPKIALS